MHHLRGYSTDFVFSGKPGLQALVLKKRHGSAYLRLREVVMGVTDADRALVQSAIESAINELG